MLGVILVTHHITYFPVFILNTTKPHFFAATHFQHLDLTAHIYPLVALSPTSDKNLSHKD